MNSSELTKKEIWQGHINKAEKYSEGIGAYCRSVGVPVSSYYNWRTKLKAKSSTLKSKQQIAKPLSAFIGVTVEPERLQRSSRLVNNFHPEAKWFAEFTAHLIGALR